MSTITWDGTTLAADGVNTPAFKRKLYASTQLSAADQPIHLARYHHKDQLPHLNHEKVAAFAVAGPTLAREAIMDQFTSGGLIRGWHNVEDIVDLRCGWDRVLEKARHGDAMVVTYENVYVIRFNDAIQVWHYPRDHVVTVGQFHVNAWQALQEGKTAVEAVQAAQDVAARRQADILSVQITGKSPLDYHLQLHTREKTK